MIYNIPAHLPFAQTFAEGLLARHTTDELPQITLFLPSSQARFAFYEALSGKTILLPKIRTIGELEEGIASEPSGESWESDAQTESLNHKRRLFEVARLVSQSFTQVKTFEMAAEFLALYDSATLNGVELEKIESIAPPAEGSQYWEKITQILGLIIHRYPALLAKHKIADPKRQQAQVLRDFQITAPTIVAGSTAGTLKVYMEFIHRIKDHPNGTVVLPGLDVDMPQEEWQELLPSHPQYAMRQLLGKDRTVVKNWKEEPADTNPQASSTQTISKAMPEATSEASKNPEATVIKAKKERMRILRLALGSGEESDAGSGGGNSERSGGESGEGNGGNYSANLSPTSTDFRDATEGDATSFGDGNASGEEVASEIASDAPTATNPHTPNTSYPPNTSQPPFSSPLYNLSFIQADNERQEAALICLALMRGIHQNKKVALITRNRNLARMVAAELENYNQSVNDSAGVPLARTKIANFLLLLLACARKSIDPSAAIALTAHPFYKDRLEGKKLQRAKDKISLSQDFLELARNLSFSSDSKTPYPDPKLKNLDATLRALKEVTKPETKLSFSQILTQHIKVAEALDPELWQRPYAAQMVACLKDLLKSGGEFLPRQDYATCFGYFMNQEVVRPKAALGAKIFIWGSMEARFQKLDLAVLGGLSEGNWPPSPRFNPWLSRNMIKELGLGSADTKIGLAAHDFIQCFGSADEVILTTAHKRDYRLMPQSRWLERFEYLLPEGSVSKKSQLPSWLEARNKVKTESRKPPVFALPKDATLPTSFSLTDLRYLKANPYVFYIQALLRLKPILTENYYALRGTFAHLLAERLATEEEEFEPARPLIQKLIGPYKNNKADYFLFLESYLIDFADALESAEFKFHFKEIKGEAKLGDFTIRTKADVVVKNSDGTYTIADYKTGSLPSKKSISEGLTEPQLPLMGYVLNQNGFSHIKDAKAGMLCYLSFDKKTETIKTTTPFPKQRFSSEELSTPQKVTELITRTANEYKELLNRYLKTKQPMEATKEEEGYLTHIIRTSEWQ